MHKFYINAEITNKPFGGGIKFAKYLYKFLLAKNCKIAKNLNEKDIDYIINISFLKYIYTSSPYSYLDVYNYKKNINPECKIITRINNTASKGVSRTEYNNFLRSQKYCDKIIFISEYTKNQYLNFLNKKNLKNFEVIKNGANKKYFYRKFNNSTERYKKTIITHHWSPNFAKGHKLYLKLDKALNNLELRKMFEFIFVGRIPKNLKYKNMKIISPKKDEELGRILRSSDIYITGTLKEASGMHHIEAAACGLPILYINSGALKEYCKDYGVEINYNNFLQKILRVRSNYKYYSKKMNKFNLYDEKIFNIYFKSFLKTKTACRINFLEFHYDKIIYFIENIKEILKVYVKNILKRIFFIKFIKN